MWLLAVTLLIAGEVNTFVGGTFEGKDYCENAAKQVRLAYTGKAEVVTVCVKQ